MRAESSLAGYRRLGVRAEIVRNKPSHACFSNLSFFYIHLENVDHRKHMIRSNNSKLTLIL